MIAQDFITEMEEQVKDYIDESDALLFQSRLLEEKSSSLKHAATQLTFRIDRIRKSLSEE